MRELQDIVMCLLDRDGTARDVNFESPTWEGLGDLMEFLEGGFEGVSCVDGEGRDWQGPLHACPGVLLQKDGVALLDFHGGKGLVQELQVFVCLEDDGSPFVELTFAPEVVAATSSLRDDFIEWVEEMQARLRSRRSFVRYENASWRFGDTGAHSGVFLVTG